MTFVYWRKRHGEREEAYLSDTDCGMSVRVAGFPDQVEFIADVFSMVTNRHGNLPDPADGPEKAAPYVDPNQTTIYDQEKDT